MSCLQLGVLAAELNPQKRLGYPPKRRPVRSIKQENFSYKQQYRAANFSLGMGTYTDVHGKQYAISIPDERLVYHGYHSTALPLRDSRVLSAGGNVGGANAQIFFPAVPEAALRQACPS